MFFKLEQTISSFRLGDKVLRYEVNNSHVNIVNIFEPSADDQKAGHKLDNAHCSVITERDISKKVAGIFEKIANNKILKPDEKVYLSYLSQNGERIELPALSAFPAFFTQFLEETKSDMSSSANRVVSAIRWRCGMLGPTQAISHRNFSWSYDAKYWHCAPSRGKIIITPSSNSVRIKTDEQKDIENLLCSGSVEPLHHELFREAWSLRLSDRRSALLIGFTSLEVAVKYFLTTKMPEAKWLVENLPAPPIEKILRDYLPKLTTINGVKVALPDSDIMDTIKKGISNRNTVAHLGANPPSAEKNQEYLVAIRACLWMMDFNNGNEWALKNIGKENRSVFI